MSIRNANIAAGITTVGGVTTIYTVPAGFVLLLKWYSVYNQDAAASQVNGRIHNPAGSGYAFLFAQNIGIASFFDWSGWVALNAGQTVLLQSSSINQVYWLAGALLPFNPTL